MAISLTPPDDPFVSTYLRGRVIEWLDGDHAWPIVDELAEKYIGVPYPRDQERVVALVKVDHAGSFNPADSPAVTRKSPSSLGGKPPISRL